MSETTPQSARRSRAGSVYRMRDFRTSGAGFVALPNSLEPGDRRDVIHVYFVHIHVRNREAGQMHEKAPDLQNRGLLPPQRPRASSTYVLRPLAPQVKRNGARSVKVLEKNTVYRGWRRHCRGCLRPAPGATKCASRLAVFSGRACWPTVYAPVTTPDAKASAPPKPGGKPRLPPVPARRAVCPI